MSEAFRNVASRGSRAGGPLIALVVLSGFSALLAYLSWIDLQTDISARQDSGWSTFLYEADEPTISAVGCDRLAQFAGIDRSGAVDRLGGVSLLQLGGVDVPLVRVSNQLIAPDMSAQTSLMMGPDLARRAGLSGQGLVSVNGVAARVEVWDLAGRSNLGGSILEPFPTAGLVDLCIIELIPSWVGRYEATVISQLDLNGSVQPLLRRGTRSGEFETHPYYLFTQRNSRYVPLAGGLMMGLGLSVVYRSRGSEFATYLLAGMTVGDLVTLVFLENLITTFAAIVAFIAAFAVAHSAGVPLASARWGFYGALVYLPISLLPLLRYATRPVVPLLKDR